MFNIAKLARKSVVPAVAIALMGASALSAHAVDPTYTVGTFGTMSTVYVQFADGSTGAEYVASIPLKNDAGTVIGNTYCIDIHTSVSQGTTGYKETAWSNSGIAADKLAYAKWALQHGFQYDKPAESTTALAAAAGAIDATESQAQRATQTALWHYTDGISLTSSNNANVLKMYNYLTGSANVGSTEDAMQRVSITASSNVQANGNIGPIKVSGGKSAATLTSSTSAQFVYADGSAVDMAAVAMDKAFYLVAPATSGDTTLSATSSVTVTTGTAFYNTEARTQTLILVNSFDRDETVKATLNWTVAPAPTTSTGTTTAPAPTTSTAAPTTSTPAPTTTTSVEPVPTTTTTTPAPVPTTTTEAPAPTTTTAVPAPTTTTAAPTTSAPTTTTTTTVAPVPTKTTTAAPVPTVTVTVPAPVVTTEAPAPTTSAPAPAPTATRVAPVPTKTKAPKVAKPNNKVKAPVAPKVTKKPVNVRPKTAPINNRPVFVPRNVQAPVQHLPFTGFDASFFAFVGGCALLGGWVIVLVTRRPRRTGRHAK